MKKLFAILLALLLLLCACAEDVETPPPEETQESSSQTSEEPKPPERLLQICTFEENGKFGIKNLEGEIIEPAEYEFHKGLEAGICLYNSAGTDILPRWNEGIKDYEMTEQKVFDMELFMFDGTKVPNGPFRRVEIFEEDEGVYPVSVSKKNEDISYYYQNGEFTEAWHSIDKNPEAVVHGYEIFQDGLRGLRAPDGTELIPPYNSSISFPFEDRVICRRGPNANQAIDCGREFIYELPSGKILNQSYNEIYTLTYDEGYIFIGITSDLSNEARPVLPDGSYAPTGYWFTDKNGDPVSERYDRISTSKEVLWDMYVDSLDTVFYCFIGDEIADEFVLRDILIKG